MSDDFTDDLFKKLSDEIMLAELTRALISTTHKCGEASMIDEDPNFRRLMMLLCIFGISITNAEARSILNEIIDKVEIPIDEEDEDENDFNDELNNQKWWDN